ncbi:MAG: enoyl-CoA hydratase, partial [Gammaproteobacteria bacterium]|nr:enoyl-CoA hydratase [Gammaproteobacteria bacterium]
MATEFEHLQYEVTDQVAVLTLDRPERLNALTPQMRESLLEAVTLADNDDVVRAIIITG